MEVNNSLTSILPNVGCVIGTILDTSGTPTLSQLSGSGFEQGAVSIVDNGTGDYTVSVTNFRGPQGYLLALANAVTISLSVAVTAASYTASTDTANFTFAVEDDASTATDSSVHFILLAL